MDEHEIRLSAGTIRYRDVGEGPPVVFLHGFLVDGSLWRKVIPAVAAESRCLVPDWPLGSHRTAMEPHADLSPRGVARLVDEFLAALGLEDVTHVANDTGGAIAQLLVAERPQRIGRLVLTPCDCFENFLPPAFRPLQYAARIPGALTLALQPLRARAPRRLPIAFGWLTKRRVPDEVTDGWVAPFFADGGVRRDARKLVRAISNRDTLDAAARLHAFDKPVLVAWATEDRFFKESYGRRLAALFPRGRFVGIPDSYTFVSEDQPERLAELILEHVREEAGAAA